MTNITITNESLHDVTIISNIFIDYYMSDANGEYVKTYLYLLRAVTTGEVLSVVSIADKLNYTERDVCRALKFWEKHGILSLKFRNDNSLESIRLLPITKPQNTPEIHTENMVQSVAKITTPASTFQEPQKHAFTLDEMAEFKSNTDVEEILFIAEQYLGKTLSNTDINSILYIYDGLKFPVELIEYLIEYCVTKDHRSMHYIEATALAWARDNISTVEQAKHTYDTYNKNCFAVLKAFGIKNRHPAPAEQEMITTWTKDYGFSLDIIVEACNRTIQAIHTPNFGYADRILVRWKEQGVHHLSDIQVLDQKFQQEKAQKKEQKKQTGSAAPNTTNRFINFEQRSYDFNELERDLLNS